MGKVSDFGWDVCNKYRFEFFNIDERSKSIQRMAQNTALFKENWDMGKAIPTLQDLLDKQVIDNRKQIENGKGQRQYKGV